MTKSAALPAVYGAVHSAVVDLLESARHAAARNVNAVMTTSYWEIGRRIVEFEQGGSGRAGYGEALLQRLAADLTQQFGRGFSPVNLRQMRRFYLAWPVDAIFQSASAQSHLSPIRQTVSAKSRGFSAGATGAQNIVDLAGLAARFALPWSAYVRLLSVKTSAARGFYETEALRCGWTVRQLDRQINSQLYERIALSKNKVAMLAKAERVEAGDAITPEDAIRDPFVLEFLNLKDQYSESDLEEALIRNLADFLLELGDDFAFVGRQRRLRLDDKWFRIDLLFFHRRLKCLLVIDLKVGQFGYADAGQMHLYLNYARAHWVKPGENPPVGLILCAGKGATEAHYALEGLPNKVLAAEYRTMLPGEHLLAKELERSRLALAASRLAGKKPRRAPKGSRRTTS